MTGVDVLSKRCRSIVLPPLIEEIERRRGYRLPFASFGDRNNYSRIEDCQCMSYLKLEGIAAVVPENKT